MTVPPLSDYDAFMSAGIPFLFYTMGCSEHYHALTDTPAYLANGFDDHATMASLPGLLDTLIPVYPKPIWPTSSSPISKPPSPGTGRSTPTPDG